MEISNGVDLSKTQDHPLTFKGSDMSSDYIQNLLTVLHCHHFGPSFIQSQLDYCSSCLTGSPPALAPSSPRGILVTGGSHGASPARNVLLQLDLAAPHVAPVA